VVFAVFAQSIGPHQRQCVEFIRSGFKTSDQVQKVKVPKIKEFCNFYIVHRRDAKHAEVFYKDIFSLRPLRLCGEI
jgi:hypothetical protein